MPVDHFMEACPVVDEAVDAIENAVREYKEMDRNAPYIDRFDLMEVIVDRWPEALAEVERLRRQNKTLYEKLSQSHHVIASTRVYLEMSATAAFCVYVVYKLWWN